MTDKEIIRAANDLIYRRLGHNGVTRPLFYALNVIASEDNEGREVMQYHFNSYVAKAGEIAEVLRKEHIARKKKDGNDNGQDA